MRDFITPEEANSLAAITPKRGPIHTLIHPTALRIIERLRKDFDFTVKNESFYSVESQPAGHNWHIDTGDTNQMLWCAVGASVLLTEGISGGLTYYSHNSKGENPELSNRRVGDILAHTSDEWHKVTPNGGGRAAFLLFI